MHAPHLPAPHIMRPWAHRRWHHPLHLQLLELFALPFLIVLFLVLVERVSGIFPTTSAIHFPDLLSATTLSLTRLAVAYVLALVCAVPLALAATHSAILQKILLPLFDILQSIPILAFFPLLIVICLNAGIPDVAAIFIIFLAMLWNIVFAIIGGIGLIPRDIIFAAEVFGLRGWAYVRRVVLPAIVPQTVTGSILAVAQGWNILIVVEVIRTYVPTTSSAHNLIGLGSTLVEAAAAGNNSVFFAALATVVVIIALINFFVWQSLLAWAQRFRFE